MTHILIACAIIVAILVVLWFFVIHKHVATIHAKVDSILNHVASFGRPPGMTYTVGEPQPQKKP